ncbi:MAG: formylglycine-generating enzyme family protein [Chloroflexi bacterium]|nr:formylglycine-generating enzyme family protein [Chloroflexota bacterium]
MGVSLAALALLAACNPTPAAPTATPPPPTTVPVEPVTANADWTPVEQTVDGVVMVQVPPGCFMMGSDAGRRDERPASQVCFTAPYWIDKTEVTNKQFGSEGAFPGDNQPRGNLLWSEARDFCVSRGGRLPTEAEWEYAGRGPDNLMYPWGSDLVGDFLVFDQNNNNQTAEVGSKPDGASWVGALDMAGNVWEWVSSAYARYPYTATDGREDLADTTVDRVYRGGVHNYIDFGAGMTSRFSADQETRDWFVGFRCVKDTL